MSAQTSDFMAAGDGEASGVEVGSPGRARDSRRSFLRRSTLLAVPGMVVAAASRSLAAKRKPKPPRFPPLGVNASLARILINEIMNDEAAHVPILQELLDDDENPLTPKIRPMPVLNMANVVQRNVQTFLETAAAFENTGSGTYGGALFAVEQTDEYFPTAVGLCTVESRHASFLNALLGDALVPNFAPVEAPIAQEITLARVAPFVSDPVVGLPSFDPETASEENNFRVLDFLLFLEYIEAAFYRVNVPRLMGDGLPRQSVSGKVTFGGQPLENGTVQFIPDDPGVKDPTSGGSPIQGGSYAIGPEVGLVPGKYKVSISSPSTETAQGEAPGSASALPKERIPSQYNTASTLSAEVKAGQGNTFDFNLEK